MGIGVNQISVVFYYFYVKMPKPKIMMGTVKECFYQ